jgi:hypothetical protein
MHSFRLAIKLGSIESVDRSFAGARVWSCVRIQARQAHVRRMLVRQVGPRMTESGGSQR